MGSTAEGSQAWTITELALGPVLVVPTTWQGEVVLRLCIVNPRTTGDVYASILATLVGGGR